MINQPITNVAGHNVKCVEQILRPLTFDRDLDLCKGLHFLFMAKYALVTPTCTLFYLTISHMYSYGPVMKYNNLEIVTMTYDCDI
jgi:hypothetical protein